MQQRYVRVLAVIGLLMCVAVVGAVGGTYLADRTASSSTDPSASSSADPTRAGTDSTPAGPVADSPEPSEPAEPSASPQKPTDRTYAIDRKVYDELSLTVTLVSAEVTDGKLRLNLRYRNDALLPWPLTCPTAEVDRTSSRIVLSDGRTVYPERSWCATTRPGESITLAPGEQSDTWAVFPEVPEAGSSFSLHWYDFPELDDIRLR
ncbi:hypothetical protein [Micromonospora yangpuensis]|uniref:hypothetical protein n=1 Tax=Micromonospora yangpuensis TaxID=683228 RepID=UPI001112EA4C|nr:hypothetical protein [Micromonospora yangpuensis]GGM18669.1 hypothetical protein GCM10012279_41230 [Micromonospora yangpuensis]